VLDAMTAADDPGHLQPSHLPRPARQLRERLVGEQTQADTWERTWQPCLARLAATAESRMRDWRPGLAGLARPETPWPLSGDLCPLGNPA
jgi:hypothetical protein